MPLPWIVLRSQAQLPPQTHYEDVDLGAAEHAPRAASPAHHYAGAGDLENPHGYAAGDLFHDMY